MTSLLFKISRFVLFILPLFMIVAIPEAEAKEPTHFAWSDIPTKPLRGKAPDLTKARLVIVDFWATWCTPCLAALPFYEELHQKYQNQGVVFLSFSEDESPAEAQKLLQKIPFSFPAYWDEGKKLASKLKLESIPVLFILDSKGKILSVERGFSDKKKKDLPQKIESLLKQNPALKL